MKSVHLVICDLFLPADLAGEVCAGLRLPSVERMLARGASTGSARTGVGASTGSARTDVGASAGSAPTELGASTGSARTDVGASAGSARTEVAGPAPSAGSGPSTSSGRAGAIEASLESYLCELFGVPCEAGAPIAPISASFDGLAAGCWLRADPVHLSMQRNQMILLPDLQVRADEATQMCTALNEHFAGQGMEFFAPHPQRWYLRVERLPVIETVPLSQAAGRDVHGLLPTGADALHWHMLSNEIQMLLFSNPVNEAREARGELPVNSLWLWGGGCTADAAVQKNFASAASDDVLVDAFSMAAGASFAGWPAQWSDTRSEALPGSQLLVWTGLRRALKRGDLEGWRLALQEFETAYAQPLWRALHAGKISQLQLDILGGERPLRLRLDRAGAWAFWRRARPLAAWSGV